MEGPPGLRAGPFSSRRRSAGRATITSVRILYLTDRLSLRGGADLHLRQVVAASVAAGARVTMGFGRAEQGCPLPAGVEAVRLRGLAARVASTSRLSGLRELLAAADVIHLQNVLNPVVLSTAAATGRAVVTVQDHRMFCPAAGKTLPDGSRCRQVMGEEVCRACLVDPRYRMRTLALTWARCHALHGARLIVLSAYMRDELAAVGCAGAEVVPPWVEDGQARPGTGSVFLLAGRLVRHKAPLDAWRAWRAAGAPLPLEVAGEGPLAVRLAGARRLGWLGSRGMQEVLDRTRALLLPARWQEPFGMVGLEVLARGVPVVVADVGGTREWSRAGCVRAAAGDVAAMAQAVDRLARRPDDARRLGEEGRAAVVHSFARDRLEPTLNRIYEQVASPAGGGGASRAAG